MKKIYLSAILFIAAISITALSSCRFGCVHGSGHQVSESHKLTDFTKIEISGGFKVNLKQDSSLNVTITTDDNLMKYMRTSVDGDKLRISAKRNFCSSGETVISIGVRNLEAIETGGAVDLNSDGKINTKDLHFELNGASKVNMDLSAANVTIEGNGATEINLKGQASSNKLEFSGSGKIYAFDFVVGSCNIETTGASHCEINVLHDLTVNTTGAADVQYKGNPTSVNSSKTGSASITKVN